MEADGCGSISDGDEFAVAVRRKTIERCREGGEVFRNVSNFGTGGHWTLHSSAGVRSVYFGSCTPMQKKVIICVWHTIWSMRKIYERFFVREHHVVMTTISESHRISCQNWAEILNVSQIQFESGAVMYK